MVQKDAENRQSVRIDWNRHKNKSRWISATLF